MNESIKQFFNLLFDNSKSWTFKAAAGISIIGFIVLTDLILNFTYSLHTSSKLTQLEKLQTLKREYESDSLKFKKINLLEDEILNKEHYTEFLSRNFSNLAFKDDKRNKGVSKTTEKPTNANVPVKSLFWMAFSSNYLLVLMLPFLIFLPVYNRETRTGTGILGWFASLIIMGSIGILVTWISYQIPLIWNKPLLNYILNFLIHTLFFILIVQVGNRKAKKN